MYKIEVIFIKEAEEEPVSAYLSVKGCFEEGRFIDTSVLQLHSVGLTMESGHSYCPFGYILGFGNIILEANSDLHWLFTQPFFLILFLLSYS